MVLEAFRTQFQLEPLTVWTTAHWCISVRPVPATLGALVISARREVTSLAELTPDEGADLTVAIGWVETKLRQHFQAEKFNYLALMMVDPLVHFHVIPRYSQPRQFGGLEWLDAGWPKPPELGAYAERKNHPALHELVQLLRL